MTPYPRIRNDVRRKSGRLWPEPVYYDLPRTLHHEIFRIQLIDSKGRSLSIIRSLDICVYLSDSEGNV